MLVSGLVSATNYEPLVYACPVSELSPARKKRTPTLEVECSLREAGHAVVAGVDEAGWGAWAGPLSVGVAVVPKDQPIPIGLRDSKALKERQREALFDRVTEWCTHWAVGHATHAECDEMGLATARRRAADRALDALGVKPHYFLVDGDQDFVGCDNTCLLPKGDARSASISAAAILAKVVRDRIMCDLSPHFPGYDFESNKGEYSPRHKEALLARGPSDIHRGSVKLKVKLKNLPMTGNPHHVRPESPARPLGLVDYSRLSQLFEPGGVTRRR